MAAIAEQAARLPDAYLHALAPALADARAELRRDLEEWLTQIPDGELRFTAQRYRQALLQLEHTLEVVEKRLPTELEGTLRAQGAAVGSMAIAHLQEEVSVFAAVFGHSVRPLQLTEAAILAEGSTQLIPRYRASAARYGKAMSADIRRMLATGVVRGETFGELTRRLIKHGGPRGLVSLRGVVGEPGAIAEVISEGLFKRYNYWAERIVRTEGLHAYNVQHQAALEEADRQDPGYLKRWDAAADKRLCELCAELDGKVVDLDGNFAADSQGRTIEHPPRHPNCRCALTPWRPEWDEEPATSPEQGREPLAPGEVSTEGHERIARLDELDARVRKLSADGLHGERPLEAELATLQASLEPGGKMSGVYGEPRDRLYEQINALQDEIARRKAAGPTGELAKALDARTKQAAKLKPEEHAWRTARTLAGAKADASRAFTEARRSVDAALQGQGLQQRAGDTNLNVKVRKIPHAAGLHGWDGEIIIDKGSASMARDFSKAYVANPAKVRAQMAEAARLRDDVVAIEQELDRAHGAAEGALHKLRGLSSDKRSSLWVRGELPEGLTKLQEKHAREYLRHRAARDELIRLRTETRRAAASHPGAELLRQADGVGTLVHEALHGHSPITAGAYARAGAVVEEITTEVAARRQLVEQFGVPPSALLRKGSYGKWIDPLTDEVARLYGVTPLEANQIIGDAAMALKRDHGELLGDADRLVELFVDKFPPTKDAQLERVSRALVGPRGRQRNRRTYALESLLRSLK